MYIYSYTLPSFIYHHADKIVTCFSSITSASICREAELKPSGPDTTTRHGCGIRAIASATIVAFSRVPFITRAFGMPCSTFSTSAKSPMPDDSGKIGGSSFFAVSSVSAKIRIYYVFFGTILRYIITKTLIATYVTLP